MGECPRMSEDENKENQNLEGIVTKKIVHEIKITGQDEKLQAELKQKDDMLKSLALKEFEERKESIVQRLESRYGKEKAEEIGESIISGKDVDSYENLLTVTEDDNQEQTRKVPSGKVKGAKPTSEDENYGSTQELVDKVYDELERQKYLQMTGSKDYDPSKHQKLQGMADAFLSSLVHGEKNRNKITSGWKVWECPKCHRTVVNSNVCPNPSCEGQTAKGYNEGIERDRVIPNE